jgi:DNA replication protein DnaC
VCQPVTASGQRQSQIDSPNSAKAIALQTGNLTHRCRLRLPTIRAVVDEATRTANREQLSYQGFLAELLLAECDDRDRRSSVRRVKAAGFPWDKCLGDFDANPNISPATINTLATGDCVRRGATLSHRPLRHRQVASPHRYRHCRGGERPWVRHTLATRLVNELAEAADEKNLARSIPRCCRVDLLLIDEFGYMELGRRGAEHLFQVLTDREENNSIAIASNESFSGWTKTFTHPRLCAAIVDRLTFNGTIIETGTNFRRLAHTRQQQTV